MNSGFPQMSVTKDALVIRIPWESLRSSLPAPTRQRRLTAEGILKLVEAGRRAHRLGKTKLIGSLRELMA
jgi:hypothetical protein